MHNTIALFFYKTHTKQAYDDQPGFAKFMIGRSIGQDSNTRTKFNKKFKSFNEVYYKASDL